MSRPRTGGALLLLMGSVLFVLFGTSMERTSIVSMIDFKTVYCGARALLQHSDPYNAAVLKGIYLSEAAGQPSDPHPIELSVTRYIYPPTTFALTLPFALFPWGPAHVLWMFFTAATLILAAFLVWTVAAPRAPVASALLLAVLLITSELLIEVGNAAGIAVALAVIAAWCFLQERFVLAGILCLALALLVKPHNAALIWLYFLLGGGPGRKRALQVLALVVVLAVPLVLWTSAVSPNWLHEMNLGLAAHSLHGADSDPGPDGVVAWTHGAQLISLQTVLSLFWDEPRFYNPVTYLLCGALLLAWIVAVIRSRRNPTNAWPALAAAAALSMLPTYHRQQDTRLILLLIPAFALLWSDPSRSIPGSTAAPASMRAVRWIALAITAAAVLLTGDSVLQLLGLLHRNLGITPAGFSGIFLTLLLARPAPLALLAAALFYLWTLRRQSRIEGGRSNGQERVESAPEPTLSESRN